VGSKNKLKKLKKKPVSGHDNFFKLVFSDSELLRELLELFFSEEEQRVFDFNDIKIEKDTHEKQLADLVLSFPLKDEPEKRVDFMVITEHKSYQDKDYYNQMLRYIISKREFTLLETGREKPIIAVLFYHGKELLKLKKSLQEESFKDFFDKIPLQTRKSMLNFSPKILDTGSKRASEIIDAKESKIWGLIKLFRDIWYIDNPSSEKIKSLLGDDLGVIIKSKSVSGKRRSERIVSGVAEYLKDKAGLNLDEWEKAERELVEEGVLTKGGTMDTLEVVKEKGRWEGLQLGREEGLEKGRQEGLQEGRQEGLQEGRQEGLQEGLQKGLQEVIFNMLKKDVDREFISEMTGISVKEIEKLKNGS